MSGDRNIENEHDADMLPIAKRLRESLYGYKWPRRPRKPQTEKVGPYSKSSSKRVAYESYSKLDNEKKLKADPKVTAQFPKIRTLNPLQLLSDARRVGLVEEEPKQLDKIRNNEAYKAIAASPDVAQDVESSIKSILKSNKYRKGLAGPSNLCREKLDWISDATKGRPTYAEKEASKSMISVYRDAQLSLIKCHQDEVEMLLEEMQKSELQKRTDKLTPTEEELKIYNSSAKNFSDLTAEEQKRMCNDILQLNVFRDIYRRIQGDPNKLRALELKYGKKTIDELNAANLNDFNTLDKVASVKDDALKNLHAQICAEELLSPFHQEEEALFRKGIDKAMNHHRKQCQVDSTWAIVLAQQSSKKASVPDPQNPGFYLLDHKGSPIKRTLVEQAQEIHREVCNKKIAEEKERLRELKNKQEEEAKAAGLFTISSALAADDVQLSEEFLSKYDPEGLPTFEEIRTASKLLDIPFRFKSKHSGTPIKVVFLYDDNGTYVNMYMKIPGKMTPSEVRKSPVVNAACESLMRTIWSEHEQKGTPEGERCADLIASSEAHASVLIRAALSHKPPFKPENIKLTIKENIENKNDKGKVICDYNNPKALADAFPEAFEMSREYHNYRNYQPDGTIEGALGDIPELWEKFDAPAEVKNVEYKEALFALDELIKAAEEATKNSSAKTDKTFAIALNRALNTNQFKRGKTWKESFSGRSDIKVDEKYSPEKIQEIKTVAEKARVALNEKRGEQLAQSYPTSTP